MNLPDLLEEITSRGWYIYSIRERTPDLAHFPDRYCCTLRCEAGLDSYIGYGESRDLLHAIANAIESMELKIPHTKPAIVSYDEPAIDLQAIMSAR